MNTAPTTLATAVLDQARRTPGATAVRDGDHSLDYAALDAASAAVARALRHRGVRPGQAVAVCLPRSRHLVCAMLGILRLGAVVVPLDAQSPPDRRAHILADAGCTALLHDGTPPAELPGDIASSAVPELIAAGSADDAPLPEPARADVSFVFYTSGTTGRPKGVEVRDVGILRLARPGRLRPGPPARHACLSNPAFDAISFEVWVPLLTGGCCVVLGDEDARTPDRLAAALRRERVDTVFITVALFNAVVDQVPDCFADAGQVLIGGEQLNAPVVRAWYRHNAGAATQLYNVYGPTEATTFALIHPIPRDFDGDVVPIGRELPGTEALLVADGERAAAPGELAELHLAGEALAAGYRNLPEETGRRFVHLPWHDGGDRRWYRTGDLVRLDAAGQVVHVGRADRQVKVRGFRIEPGELERQILTHPAVRRAHVRAHRDETHGVNELVAYVVLGADLDHAEYERHLAATLPSYMRPHRTHLVGELPLTANGKVDQKALLARAGEPWRPDGAGGPAATDLQRDLLALAGEILGGVRPGLGDRWIACGGDSLKALRLRFEVRRRWGRDLPHHLVLAADFARLAEEIETGRDASVHPPVPAPTGARTAPATSEQQRLWLLQQRAPHSRAYNVGQPFRIDGTVDTAALREALRRLVARHAALRTGFTTGPEGLLQTVGDPYDPWTGAEPEDGDWRGTAGRFFAEPFDLARPRMLRARWLESPDGGGHLLLHLHHIAVDGWSLSVLFRELSAEYAASVNGDEAPEHAPAPPTPLDHAAWQHAWSGQPAYAEQRAALRDHFAGAGEPDAPLEPARPGAGPEGRLLHVPLDAGLRVTLDRLGAELGLTRFQLLLGVFAWSLYGVTGRTRPRVAAPVAGRPVREFEDSVGMFANTVLLPLDLRPDEDLRAQLLRLADGTRTVLDRQDVALADVLADRAFPAGRTPFDVLFVLENTDFAALALPGCRTRPAWLAPAEAKCPLTLSVIEHEDGLDCLWEYAADHFAAADAEALAALFRQGLDRLADGGTATLAELVAPHRAALPDHGRGAPVEPAFTTVAEGFARQVRATPDAPAVAWDDRTLTYAELDAHAAALADGISVLTADGGGPRRVALLLEPSPEHVVALLALARLNLTIVPLDPAYPPALLRQILDRARPLCVLLPPDGAGVPEGEVVPDGLPRHRVVLPDDPAPAPGFVPHDATEPLYLLFTSGSTGTPKGVQVPDRTLCDLLHWQTADGGLAPGAVTQQFSALSFDVSFQEIFSTLCGGGRLHLARPGWRQDAPALLEQLDTAGIERLHLPYVALQLLAEHAVRIGAYPARLREVVTAGEQLVCTDAIRRWFAGLPGARLFNHYGPTETHVVSGLCLDGDPAGWPERPAIGRPAAGAHLRVVDGTGQPVPPGCPGDLIVGGPMAAPCYADDEELNRARFTELPGLGLFYRTGDRARFGHDGLLHFLGRDDQQVKLSGHRLELGQIEAALLRHPAIVNAVVVLDDGLLTACLECPDTVPGAGELAAHLAELLPGHVRVARFRRVDALPLTPSGKLDRRRAPAAPGEDLRPDTAAPALTPREARLAELFAAVTGRPVGPDERFFDAGATSLDLMRFHLRCTTELGLDIAIPDLFEHVTIRRLAAFADRGSAPEPSAPAVAAGPADEPIAVVGMAVRLPGADDLAAFWSLVESGGRGIEHFDAADGLVGARSRMSGLLAFDPEHFGISRHEARLMDPQQRHLLMTCVQALAHAGIADPAGRRVGLVASCGENTYFQSMLREADPDRLPDSFQMALHHDKDFLATKAAFHLGLTGPAFTVQAACASSLVAVHVGAGLLRQGDADVVLAGGVLVDTLLGDGYRYRPQHIFSKDGHCRPFSDDASGTIGASGVGAVVLKPLRLARRDGDTVYAVVTGSALNNDGAGKAGYSAPSLAGQREVIRTALRRSGRTAADLGYVEAHGTGTQLGDPVEVAALRQAFGPDTPGDCALASVKSQIGHLGAAAGVVGMVRAALAVHHGVVPPNVGFHRLNPRIEAGPFTIPAEARPWPAGRPRVAAVSSFGIGGTNAHLVLEAGTERAVADAAAVPCLTLSSSSEQALRTDAARIADYLTARPETYGQVLRHLQAGRPARRRRAAAVCADAAAAVAWLRAVAGTEVTPVGEEVAAEGRTAAELAAAFTAGRAVRWPAGPAQAPWDFPPPAFDLADYDFERAAPERQSDDRPERLPETDWLHQPQWVRLHRAGTGVVRRPGVLVVLTDGPLPEAALRPLTSVWERVVRVTAADAFARVDDDVYRADPADAPSLRRLLDAVAGDGAVDWLHALPLAVTGAVGEESAERARWACLDTPAALLRAVTGTPLAARLRPWWLSYGAQPVEGAVHRPELALLAGAAEIAPQECAVDGRWLDLPGADPADWAARLPDLLARADAEEELPRRLALRRGFWWRQALLPVAVPAATAPSALPEGPAVHVVLGGTGGIGSSVAAWLLEHSDCRVVLLARRPRLPDELAPWADRVALVPADLAEDDLDALMDRIARHAPRVDGVVHAAGVAAGSLVARRDAAAMRGATAAKVRGALLVERIVERHAPAFAAYCSSMAALFGGIGQLDYAAANGLLDGFALYGDGGTTVRVGIDWDIWSETGMALGALETDARHRAHLAVGLATKEGRRLFGRALQLQLPQVLVSTTDIGRAREFYAGSAGRTAEAADVVADAAGQLTQWLCHWLELDELDPAASLYDLGADSLTMIDLISTVEERFGVELELSQLSHRVSLEEVLSLLSGLSGSSGRDDAADDGPVSVEVWQRGTGRDVLCLVHPVGGDIQAYRTLVSELGPDLTVCLIADPALSRPGLPAWTLAERARHYEAALEARFPHGGRRRRLAGWSFGAWVALGMAAEAERAGRPAAGLHLIDPPPPGAGRLFRSYDDEQLEAVFAHELSQGGDGGGREAAAYAERLAHCCRANLAAMAEHELPRLAGTPSRLWLAGRPVSGLPAPVPVEEQRALWERQLPGLRGVRCLDTTHYGVVREPHVRVVAEAVNGEV
ncbi:amino acid adenylation domain-containing protein [Streptomyces sp. AV19]|uniref:non-ribosomal peptide synthetase n=1 Tax=Streptomyces sp. AV19 TaxID=2793068 RepID=UPI0018FEB1B2|nr:non-ribosomal peptide synthetase [Streptomyces sp. AV19]MBH1937591.1 amino acid adenylation domain-containing protein [Streptomyces sp. AV19]MDG4536476.1 non-ribosomal peptide synthetase [Streptomyces sp. AV19]